MNLRPLSKSLSFFFICILFSCSPSETPAKDTPSSKPSGDLDPNQLYIQQGWRRGVLQVEVEILQKGEGHEQGKTEIQVDWETSIQAKSEEQVLVAADLRTFVTEAPDPKAHETILEYEPFMRPDLHAEPRISSSFKHHAHRLIKDPEAVDLVSSEKQVEESGQLDKFSVQSLRPSLYGKGYELSLDINIKAQRKITENSQLRKANAPIVQQEDKEIEEPLGLLFYPVPNKLDLNDYPYLPPSASAELKADLTRHHRETLSVLQQIYADSLPTQSKLRAGMISEATKDQLTLSYEYNGEKQLPFIASLDTLIGKTSPNLLRVKLTLKAQ